MTTPTGPTPVVPEGAPREVEIAFRLFLADIVLGLLGVLAWLASLPLLTREFEQELSRRGAGGFDPATITSTVVTVSVAIWLVLAAFRLVVAYRMRAGHSWARNVMLVLSALWVLLVVFRSNETAAQFSGGLLGVVSAVAEIAGLVLVLAATSYLFRPDAIRYFRTQRS